MNIYAYLPLTAFFANLILALYIIHLDPDSRLNRLFFLVASGAATWSLGNFFTFTAVSSESAVMWNILSIVGASTMSVFLFHFFCVFSKKKFIENTLYRFLIYIPGIIFITLGVFTNLITLTAEPAWWGFNILRGPLYLFYTLYPMGYVAAGIMMVLFYSFKAESKEKKQSILLFIALIIPLLTGIITEVIAVAIHYPIIPLTSTSSTAMVILIAYAISKYDLMAPFLWTLQRKLSLTFLILIILISSITFLSSGTLLRSGLEETSINQLELVTSARAQLIRLYLDKNLESIQLISKCSACNNFLVNNTHKDHIQRSFNDFLDTQKDIIKITLVDYSGTIVYSTDESTIDLKEEEVREALITSGLFIGDAHISKGFGSPCLDFVMPLYHDEKIIGGIIIDINMTNIADIISDVSNLGKTGESYLLNNQGVMITPSRFIDNSLLNLPVDTEISRLCRTTHDRKYVAPKQTQIYHDYRDIEVLGTYQYISEMQWCIITEMDSDEAFQYVNNIRKFNLLVILILSILGIIFSIYFSKSITNPFKVLQKGIEIISKGNFEYRTNIKTNDEIGQLSESFDKMAGELGLLKKDLEIQIQKRTKELKRKVDELEKFQKFSVGRELKMIQLKKEIGRLKK